MGEWLISIEIYRHSLIENKRPSVLRIAFRDFDFEKFVVVAGVCLVYIDLFSTNQMIYCATFIVFYVEYFSTPRSQ